MLSFFLTEENTPPETQMHWRAEPKKYWNLKFLKHVRLYILSSRAYPIITNALEGELFETIFSDKHRVERQKVTRIGGDPSNYLHICCFFSKQRCFLMGRPALYLLLQHHYTIEKLKCILIIISSFPPVKSTKNSVFENKIILLHA